jgi:hypothetical protein
LIGIEEADETNVSNVELVLLMLAQTHCVFKNLGLLEEIG